MGVVLGTMAGVGGAVGGMVGGAVNNAMNADVQPMQISQQPADDLAVFRVKVEKLNLMKETGLISDKEFMGMKAKLLSDII